MQVVYGRGKANNLAVDQSYNQVVPWVGGEFLCTSTVNSVIEDIIGNGC
ncbi:hypothetical protein KR51_00032110 [Rubidibacter lacunae KORDI 51-2]|uniref:Uncharacterized protein n=1 Tax=Rubidibacter lacunae KORDI 51-2 TaxID=582515 RepID=U5DI39_9CHRO|nr:hypothetical protein KR51_00032110 [Rubidibacter lacunae KORDI 51-2]